MAPPIVHEALRADAAPIDRAARTALEGRLGHDLSGVRVHTGALAAASAHAVGARAFTVGRDIVFGAGEYAPGTAAGRKLLAHELTHVTQQAPTTVPDAIPIGAHDAHEERTADAVAAGTAVPRAAAGPAVLRRQGPPDPGLDPDWMLKLTLRGKRLELTGSGPKLPVVGHPTAGLRYEGGKLSPLFGVGDTAKTPAEIREMLRGLGGGGGGSKTPLPGGPFSPGTSPKLGPGFPFPLGPGPTFKLPGSPLFKLPTTTGLTPPSTLGSGGLGTGKIQQLVISPFPTDSAAMPTAFSADLTGMAVQLNFLHPDALVHIDGHADARYTAEHNKALSQARAEAVRDQLISLGVNASRIVITAYGESRPLGSEKTDEDRAHDRRVEVWFVAPSVLSLSAPKVH